ncbi:MAG: putative ATP-dependent endonuclease of OLD family [Gammaproteobacteria bacterium]
MYLKKLTVSNFRKLKSTEFEFTQGLNIVVGANNIGKTALVDGLRSLLAGHEDPYPRFTSDDIHRPADGAEPKGDILFQFEFSGLSIEDEADFLPALIPVGDAFEAHLSVSYSPVDAGSGRMKPRRWCGAHDEISLNSDMLENLRGVYLQPLRDASQGLKPGRNSQLARLLRLLGQGDDDGRKDIEKVLVDFDNKLKATSPIEATQKAIINRHETMLGEQLAQLLTVGISGTDFNRLSARLTLQADAFDIDQNGLGFNNLIYMAVVLSEMAKDPTAAYRGLIVEEPEAHLHPQLQSVLLDYLQGIRAEKGDVQVFVTSHSPNFASIADLDSTICLVDAGSKVDAFFPRDIQFNSDAKKHLKIRQKLERYLDVTRAEIFFARRVIFVEGAAELMLISVLSNRMGAQYNLRRHAVSLISVEGLNFDSFLPLFGENSLPIPVSAITDADPFEEVIEAEKKKSIPVYPDLGDKTNISANTQSMTEREDRLVKVFYGVKTLEYDLALHEDNRIVMLLALSELHPQIAADLKIEVDSAASNQDKAKTLFCGMFEREKGRTNVQKGRYGQVLAQSIVEHDGNFVVPDYITNAVKHVCDYKRIL